MSLSQQLELAAIAEPSPISHWPAFGWWILGCLSLVLLMMGISYGVKYWRKRQRLKRSLHAIESICRERSKCKSTADFYGRLNRVLKQHLLQAGLHEALSLHGQPWREFLQQNTKTQYHQGIADFLEQLYQPDRPTLSEAILPDTTNAGSTVSDPARSGTTQSNTAATGDDRSPTKFTETGRSQRGEQWQQQIKAWVKSLPC